jgi:rhodanese-related sulfurtransferase
MAKGKSSQHSSKGKSSSKPGNSKSRSGAPGSRSTSSNANRTAVSRTGAMNKGKATSTRSAFMRGARSRGGLGTWGLIGLLGVLVVFAVLYFTGALNPKSAADSLAGLPAEISVAEAYELYPAGAFFLDVREVVEWEAGHVPDTTNIPLSELENRLSELPTDQDIVVICRSGNRSVEGRDILLDAGFENVTSMADGLREWKAAGYSYDGEILE